MERTPRLVGLMLLTATCVELAAALVLSVVARMAYTAALAPVFIVMGVGWTLVGLFVSGGGRVAPSMFASSAYGLVRWGQVSLSAELYTSRAEVQRAAKSHMRQLARSSAFMVPTVLYGLAIFVIGLWLVA